MSTAKYRTQKVKIRTFSERENRRILQFLQKERRNHSQHKKSQGKAHNDLFTHAPRVPMKALLRRRKTNEVLRETSPSFGDTNNKDSERTGRRQQKKRQDLRQSQCRAHIAPSKSEAMPDWETDTERDAGSCHHRFSAPGWAGSYGLLPLDVFLDELWKEGKNYPMRLIIRHSLLEWIDHNCLHDHASVI